VAVVWWKVFAVLPGDFCQVPKPPLFDSAIFFWCLSLCISKSRDPSQTASVQRFKTVVLIKVQLLSGRRCLLHWLLIFCQLAKPPLFDSAISFGCLSLSTSRAFADGFRTKVKDSSSYLSVAVVWQKVFAALAADFFANLPSHHSLILPSLLGVLFIAQSSK